MPDLRFRRVKWARSNGPIAAIGTPSEAAPAYRPAAADLARRAAATPKGWRRGSPSPANGATASQRCAMARLAGPARLSCRKIASRYLCPGASRPPLARHRTPSRRICAPSRVSADRRRCLQSHRLPGRVRQDLVLRSSVVLSKRIAGNSLPAMTGESCLEFVK